jgi:hypothetical protein
MNNGDAGQAAEVGGVQREGVSHPLREHHGHEAGVVGTLAANLGNADPSEGTFLGNYFRPVTENL